MLQTVRRSLSGRLSCLPSGVRLGVRGACTAVTVLALSALPAEAQKITEVVFDHAGMDTHEYIELAANPASVLPPGISDTLLIDLSSYTILELDGSTDPGRVLHAFTPGTTNASGLWSTGYMTSTLESPAFTLLLVSGFTGAVGDDLDAGNDGVLDATPWSAIADGVAFSDGTAGARTYAAPVLAPGFDGTATPPGGASRFPYYRDTDLNGDWKRNDFDGSGLPGMAGTLASGEARNTAGSVTRVALSDFYAAVDATSPSTLRSTLHAALETHIRFPYTADTTDVWDILNTADQDPVEFGKILDIYKNAVYTKISGGQGVYNREHSWPNSYGFNNDQAAFEYTDCHHLFASDTTYNSNRGNQPYGTCTDCSAAPAAFENATLLNHTFGGGTGTYPGNSNWDNGVVYEVWNHRRGDIARAQFYMDVRYAGGTHPYTGSTEADLILTDNTALIQTNQPYMGYLSVLLQWHLADPVDDAERARNDVIESFQGNRNPFVDHPEWVECVFQGTCGGNASLVFSGLGSANDPNLCAVTGVDLSWNAPAAWNDDCTSGCNRGFRILRDGVAIASGGCAAPLSATATSCSDATGTAGVSYAYAVEAFNHENETSTGNGPISATDRTDDGLSPVLATGPSASSGTGSSFTVTWTTDEPSDGRLEYGLTGAWGSTAYAATPVTAHSLTVSGLTAATQYHFRAGSTDACGNGPTWSSDGTVTTQAGGGGTLDVGGYTLTQANSTQTYTLPAGTTIPAGGYLVIARNVDKAAFETAWGVTLGPDVVFLNSGEKAPMINGGETYTLTNAVGAVLDGPTIALPSTFQSVRRNDPCLAAGSTGSWTAGPLTSATPGSGAGPGCGTGLVINEFSDATAFANEFVELHNDAPVTAPAPTVTTAAATDVTATGATLNGTVNPNGVATNASFEWGLTTSYGQTTAVQAMGTGSSAQPLLAALTALAPCTVYHYRATATSAGGTVPGPDAAFRTNCTGGRLYTLTPCRVLDTRNDSAMTGGVPRDVAFHGTCGIPSTARALATNVTVTDETSPGYLSVYPADAASTGTSVVHFSAWKTRAAMTIIKLSDDGTGHARFEATVPAGGTINVIVDVSGYFD